jgi:hypothetical protein
MSVGYRMSVVVGLSLAQLLEVEAQEELVKPDDRRPGNYDEDS